MKRVAVLPAAVTLGNGLCGFIAVAYLVRAQGFLSLMRAHGFVGDRTAFAEQFALHMEWACWLILAAMVFDALDGGVARLTHSSSEFGAQLDSLADVISFGVAPGLMVMVMATYVESFQRIGWVTGSVFMVCAMLRLARYNVEHDESGAATATFKGLPSPAAAGVVASLVLIPFTVPATRELRFIAPHLQPVMDWLVTTLPVVAMVAAFLMVSRVPYLHLFNRLLRDQEPFDYLVGVIMIVVLALLTWPFSIPLAFTLYLVFGLVEGVRHLVRDRVPLWSSHKDDE